MSARDRLADAREAGEVAMMAARLGRDLPRFLRRPLTPEQAREGVRRRMATRERRFLALIDRAVYGVARSPYRRLLANAGCERGDLHALVAQEGLEGALRRLVGLGVYVSFDELKGRREAVRGSARFAFSDRDFDNPLYPPHLFSYTGGSGGRPSRVTRSLANIAEGASIFGVALEAHGIRRPRNLYLVGGSVTWQLIHLKLGVTADAWFVPTASLPRVASLAYRYIAFLAARGGRSFPLPEHRDLQAPEVIARWLADRARPDAPIVVNGRASAAVRVAVAAKALGRSLEGVTFHCRSEPFTAARRRLIDESGARTLPDYASVELAYLSYGCPRATAPDDMHLSVDRYAVVERERPLYEGGPSVEALLFTTLGHTTPKIGLNVELGDSAKVEVRDCGCLLGELGLRTHLAEIRSFEKLSTEGTSFARSNVVQILEEVLPERFGGTALDYQLAEEEGADGTSLLVLRVAPGVGAVDEGALREALLAELGRGGLADAYQADLIRRAESIVVRRLAPIATRAGKVLPFQLARAELAGGGVRAGRPGP